MAAEPRALCRLPQLRLRGYPGGGDGSSNLITGKSSIVYHI